MDLYNNRVLTTNQLSDLHFTDPRRARERLLKLYWYRAIDRFRPFRHVGSAACHYVLDELGAGAAATLGIELKQLRYRLERDLDLVNSPRLQHLVEVNDFFVALITRCRAKPGFELEQWWERAALCGQAPDQGTPGWTRAAPRGRETLHIPSGTLIEAPNGETVSGKAHLLRQVGSSP